MARGGIENLKKPRSTEEAREWGRRGGLANAAKIREKDTFRRTLEAILDTPMEELKSISPRLAICKGMILKAASGDKQAADWVRDTSGEKPVDKQELTGADGGPVSVATNVFKDVPNKKLAEILGDDGE